MRLEAAQQRLELAVSRSAFLASASAAASSHQRQQPKLSRPSAAPASDFVPAQGQPGQGQQGSGQGQQIFMQSAPSTPMQPPRRHLRAPKGAATPSLDA